MLGSHRLIASRKISLTWLDHYHHLDSALYGGWSSDTLDRAVGISPLTHIIIVLSVTECAGTSVYVLMNNEGKSVVFFFCPTMFRTVFRWRSCHFGSSSVESPLCEQQMSNRSILQCRWTAPVWFFVQSHQHIKSNNNAKCLKMFLFVCWFVCFFPTAVFMVNAAVGNLILHERHGNSASGHLWCATFRTNLQGITEKSQCFYHTKHLLKIKIKIYIAFEISLSTCGIIW